MFRRFSHTLRAAAVVSAAGLALLAAACSSSSKVADVNSSSAGGPVKAPAGRSAEQVRLQNEYLRFARCMRSHGVSDFPDPITGSGGHPGFRLQGGSSSDLNSNNAAFRRRVEACQHVLGHEFRFVLTAGGVGKGT
jgi:hypothetical protein